MTISLIVSSSVRHHGRFAFDSSLEDAWVSRLPLALEELRVGEVGEHQQDDADEQPPYADRNRSSHSQEATRVVDVGARGLVVEEGLDEDERQDRPAEEWRHSDHDEVLHALEELLAVVDDAGEAGQPVVEGDL